MAAPRSRILDLMKVQCRIFSTTFNPEGKRMGNKVLRQRLKGATVAAYYPPRVATYKDLVAAYPDAETWDEDEEERLENIEALVLSGHIHQYSGADLFIDLSAKARGKGPPKKRKTKEDSKKFGGKKKAAPATPKKVVF